MEAFTPSFSSSMISLCVFPFSNWSLQNFHQNPTRTPFAGFRVKGVHLATRTRGPLVAKSGRTQWNVACSLWQLERRLPNPRFGFAFIHLSGCHFYPFIALQLYSAYWSTFPALFTRFYAFFLLDVAQEKIQLFCFYSVQIVFDQERALFRFVSIRLCLIPLVSNTLYHHMTSVLLSLSLSLCRKSFLH